MTERRSEFAKYSIWPIAIVLMLLVGCGQKGLDPQAVEPPRPVQTHGPIADSYFQLTIDYEYKKVAYHGTWIGHCFLYQNWQGGFDSEARWRGYAARLPDGSAVFFQPRAEICAKNQLRRLLFAPDVTDTLWDGRQLYPTPPDEIRSENDFGDSEPKTFTTPAVYWLDSPTQPVHVELCGVPACALADAARVRILGIHASPTQNTVVSNPLQAIPALAQLRSGALRHIGYACWKIPLTEINRIMSLPSGPYIVRSDIDSARARGILEWLNSFGYKTMNAWSWSWEGTERFPSEYQPIDDAEFILPLERDMISIPITQWRRGCRLVGRDLIVDGELASSAYPISFNAMNIQDVNAIEIKIPSGDGDTTSHYEPIPLSSEPDHYLLSTTSPEGDVYIGEPVEFAFDFSHGEFP